MQKVVKQVAGIDVSQNELVVSLGVLTEDLVQQIYRSRVFTNNTQGIESFVSWVSKHSQNDIPVHYVMEATGIYHEELAYYLAIQGMIVSVVLPNKVSNFFKTLDVKTITDKTASQAIALFGLSRNLETWAPPTDIYRVLRQLTRERSQLIDERTVLKNQLHAEEKRALSHRKSIDRIKTRITLLDNQEKEIIQEITQIVKSDDTVLKLVLLLCSLPGVAILTATTILGETSGFNLIRNKRQITSYAGLDVQEKQSGTSVKGKPRISKKGNKNLRKAMYLPALAAIRKDERFKALFVRLVGKHGVKKKAAVAVQRKLLEMMYTIYKTRKPYDENYLSTALHQNVPADIKIGNSH